MKKRTFFVSVATCAAVLLFASCNKEFHQYLVIENGTSDTLRIAVSERGQRNIGDVSRSHSTRSKVLAPDELFLIYDELDDGHMPSETIDDVDPRLYDILLREQEFYNVRAYRHDTCIAIWEHPGESVLSSYPDGHPYYADFNSFYNRCSWRKTTSPTAYTFIFTVKEENYYHKIDYFKK